MDIKQYYKTLELDQNVSLIEVKQAYKDLVNIWHPDRVANNPRLKQKAEEKLKEINAAYDGLTSFLSSRQNGTMEVKKAPQAQQKDKTTYHEAQPREDATHQGAWSKTDEKDSAATHVRTGPGIASTLWSYFSDFIRSLSDRQVAPTGEPGSRPYSAGPGQQQWQRKDIGRGRGMGRGGGRGMGRGGAGMGKRKGMGRGRGRR